MEDGDARLGEDLRHGVPHGHHVVAGVGGAVVAGPDRLLVPGGGVALAAVGVEDQNLGLVGGEFGVEALLEGGDGKGVVRGVGDVGPSHHGVAAGVRGDQGPGGDAVVSGLRGLQRGLLHRDRLHLLPAGGRLGVLLLAAELRHGGAGGGEQRGLAERHSRRRGEPVPLPQVPQLPAEEAQGRGLPEGLQGCPGGVAAGGDRRRPQRSGGQDPRLGPPHEFLPIHAHGVHLWDNLCGGGQKNSGGTAGLKVTKIDIFRSLW